MLKKSYEFSQLSAQLWVSDIVFVGEGGQSGVVKSGEGGGRQKRWEQGGECVEPAGLNSTAEPLTPTIHQCRGVTRQGQGYVTGGGRSDGRWRWGKGTEGSNGLWDMGGAGHRGG